MQITHHDVLADRRLARGIVTEPNGRNHRCLVDLAADRGDCSCGDAHCPALTLVRNKGQQSASDRSGSLPRSGDVEVIYAWRAGRIEICTLKEGRRTALAVETILANPAPRFVDDVDVTCASALQRANMHPDEATLLELAGSGRLVRGEARLTLDPPQDAALAWHWHENGDQSLVFAGSSADDSWPHIRVGDTIAALHHHGRWREPDLRQWRRVPLERIAESGPRLPASVPEPFVPVATRIHTVAPQGIVIVDGKNDNAVEVRFDYGGHGFLADVNGSQFAARDGDKVNVYPRDAVAESELMAMLRSRDVCEPRLPHGTLGLARFLLRDRAALEQAGWTVEVRDAPPILTGEALRLDTSGSISIQSEGQQCSPGADRLDWEGTALLKTESGAVVAVPLDLLNDILMALGSSGRTHPARLASLEMEIDNEFDDVNLQALRDTEAFTPPAELSTILREYQRAGAAWLWRLYQAGFGGILADDMGLGKTLQTLCLLAIARHESPHPCLIVAPASLLTNWQREARRFVPDLKTLVYHGSDRRPSRLASVEAAITTYGILRSDRDILAERSWNVVVLDEAHQIKNARSKAAQAARALTARQRIALSGTPMENHLGELWSVLRFAQPGLLDGEKAFTESFRRPIEQGDETIREILARRIAPFMLRRHRREVLTELPPLVETNVWVELGPHQRALYESVRATSLIEAQQAPDLPELERRAQALQILTRLRQICCAPQLLPETFPGRDAEAAKLDTAASMILELAAEDRAVLVFSQFTSLLNLMRKRLEQLSVATLMLTGSTPNRQQIVDRFQAGEAAAFLISLKAGGAGLNLTRADTVVLLDPWWNPAAEAQAAARAHRMGQTDTVFVYRLIANDTVEQAIESLKAGKTDLTDKINASLEGLNPTDPDVFRELLEHA